MGVQECITHLCQTPNKAKGMSHLLHWVSSAHHYCGCHLTPAIPFPACCAVCLRADTSHPALSPSFVIVSEGQAGNLHLRFIFIHVFSLISRFLFPKAVSDWNVTFGKLGVIFRFSQPFQHPHVNLIQPCGFFMEFLICAPSLSSVLFCKMC